MDRTALVGLLVAKASVDQQSCLKLSATRWVPYDDWQKLKAHEQQFLRAYAAGAAAHKAALVGLSAARVGGLWVVASNQLPVELAIPSGRQPSRSQWPEGTVYRQVTVPDAAMTTFDQTFPGGEEELDPAVRALRTKDNVRLTTPERTAIDIARMHRLRDGIVAFDSLFAGKDDAAKRATAKDVEWALGQMAGKKGVGKARAAYEASSQLSESPYESVFRIVLESHGIHVDLQMQIGEYRVDMLWGNLIIEIDGAIKLEDRPTEVVKRQLARENWLREQGYEVIRLSTGEIIHNELLCLRRVVEAKQRADRRGPVLVQAVPSTDRRGGRRKR